MESLAHRAAVITGAADGIGRAIAFDAARRGMRLMLADKRGERLLETADELRRTGAEVHAQVTDVTRAESVEALAEATYAHFGAAHVLVNNAGVAYANSAWDTPVTEYQRVIDVNLYGVIHGVRAFVPRMLSQGEPGHVVNIASAAGLFTVPGLAAYSASKFAVVGFSEALIHDLTVRSAQIGVSVVCPSWVRTSLVMREEGVEAVCDAEAQLARSAMTQAVHEGISPEEVAKLLFDAVLANAFYVLTHPKTSLAVSLRAADLVAGKAPRNFS